MHAVQLQALLAGERPPQRDAPTPLTLVQRTDEDFVAGLLADLTTADGRARTLAAQPPRGVDGRAFELFQPVHRAFHFALAELFCDEPGRPRLDPAKIESAGLVIRRVAVPREDGPALDQVREAWIKRPDGTKGWHSLDDVELVTWEPDPARRREVSAGNDEIDRLLLERRRQTMSPQRLLLTDAEEHVTTMFVTPPAVCKAAGRTILYGLVRTASTDTSVASPSRFSDADLDAAVPHYLRATASVSAEDEPKALPPDLRGRPLSRYDAGRLEGRPFMTMLVQLTVSLGVLPQDPWPDDREPEWASPLLAALRTLTISGRPGDQFLGEAARILVWRNAGEATVTMPDVWPTITPELARTIRDAMRPAYEAQAARVVPDEGRFESLRAEYVARAFVRVRRDDGCPPKILWSSDSERFRIKPWYAAGPQPPLRVVLPDIVPDALKDIKPNVTFVVPKGLAGFLNSNTAKSLLKGSGGRGKPDLGWICGFNIPIITICAFILLWIVLHLLNYIFWWLPFVRVCIPFPGTLKKTI